MVAPGGMHGFSWGACVVFPGGGVCMVFAGGHVWFLPGGCAWFFPGGACMVFPGGGGIRRIRQDTVNERAVRILLECILVLMKIRRTHSITVVIEFFLMKMKMTKNRILQIL